MIKEYFYYITSGITDAFKGFKDIWNITIDTKGTPDMMIPLDYIPNKHMYDDINNLWSSTNGIVPIGHYCMYLIIMLVAGGIVTQMLKDSGKGQGSGKRGKNNLKKRMGMDD